MSYVLDYTLSLSLADLSVNNVLNWTRKHILSTLSRYFSIATPPMQYVIGSKLSNLSTGLTPTVTRAFFYFLSIYG